MQPEACGRGMRLAFIGQFHRSVGIYRRHIFHTKLCRGRPFAGTCKHTCTRIVCARTHARTCNQRAQQMLCAYGITSMHYLHRKMRKLGRVSSQETLFPMRHAETMQSARATHAREKNLGSEAGSTSGTAKRNMSSDQMVSDMSSSAGTSLPRHLQRVF